MKQENKISIEKANKFVNKYSDKSFEMFKEIYDDCEDMEEFLTIIDIMKQSFLIAKTITDMTVNYE